LDRYHHLGLWWLLGIALVGAVGLTLDLLAAALGAKRAGASKQAVGGALVGTVIGLFFGLPGLLLGPFFGALFGELAAGNSVLRSTHVGMNTWFGLIFGTLLKLVSSLMMVALFGAGWWWNSNPLDAPGRQPAPAAAVTIKATLVPPKANEFDMTARKATPVRALPAT
jgi:uncharacterized protein YqgC (DUF456 family)